MVLTSRTIVLEGVILPSIFIHFTVSLVIQRHGHAVALLTIFD